MGVPEGSGIGGPLNLSDSCLARPAHAQSARYSRIPFPSIGGPERPCRFRGPAAPLPARVSARRGAGPHE